MSLILESIISSRPTNKRSLYDVSWSMSARETLFQGAQLVEAIDEWPFVSIQEEDGFYRDFNSFVKYYYGEVYRVRYTLVNTLGSHMNAIAAMKEFADNCSLRACMIQTIGKDEFAPNRYRLKSTIATTSITYLHNIQLPEDYLSIGMTNTLLRNHLYTKLQDGLKNYRG